MNFRNFFLNAAFAFPLMLAAASSTSPKTYIQLEDVSINADGMFFTSPHNQTQLRLKTLRHDDIGYYVLGDRDYDFICPNCLKYVYIPCPRCNYPLSND